MVARYDSGPAHPGRSPEATRTTRSKPSLHLRCTSHWRKPRDNALNASRAARRSLRSMTQVAAATLSWGRAGLAPSIPCAETREPKNNGEGRAAHTV
eukprot:934591-Amphidinium_carterae.1